MEPKKYRRECRRVERTGYIDHTVSFLFTDRTKSDMVPCPLAWIDAFLFAWTRFAFEFATGHVGGDPFLVGVQLVNAGQTYVQYAPIDYWGPCARAELVAQELRMAREEDWSRAAKSLADRLYNGYGQDKSPWFDDEGQFLEPLAGGRNGIRAIPWK